MRVTIEGLTDSTIKFNATGITMHGKEKARHIDINSGVQEQELRELMSLGLIYVHDEATDVQEGESLLADVEDVTDVEEPKPKKKIGRPKGAKDKKPRKKGKPSVDEDEDEIEDPELAEAIKAAAAQLEAIEASETSEKVVLGTEGGSITTSTKNKASGEIPESEATNASLETMKRLEAEEAGEEIEGEEVLVIKEEDLDPSEQMGLKAYMATGDGTIKSENMVNSILPDLNFIDPDSGIEGSDSDDIEDEIIDDDPFIDQDDSEAQLEVDSEKDPFIEI